MIVVITGRTREAAAALAVQVLFRILPMPIAICPMAEGGHMIFNVTGPRHQSNDAFQGFEMRAFNSLQEARAWIDSDGALPTATTHGRPVVSR